MKFARTFRRSLLGLCFGFVASASFAGTDAWTPLGPDLATVGALAASPDGDLWAGALGSRLYRSQDGGSRWAIEGVVPQAQAIVTDPQRPGRVWVGTANGISRTFDDGNTWVSQQLPTRLKPGQTAQLAIAPSAPDRLYAFQGALYRSRDGGAHWEPTSPLPGFSMLVLGLAVDSRDPDLVYAALFDALYRSRDGGDSWTQVPSPAGANVRALATHPTQSGVLFAGTVEQGLWKSLDRGASWRQVLSLAPGRRVIGLAFDPRAPARLYAAVAFTGTAFPAGEVWRSADGGETWRAQRFEDPVLSLAVAPGGDVFAGLERQGVLRSRDRGATWQPSRAGLRAYRVEGIAVDPRNGDLWLAPRFDNRFSSDTPGLLVSSDGGATWRQTRQRFASLAVPTFRLAFDPFHDDRLWAFGVSLVFESTDGGATWKVLLPEGFATLDVLDFATGAPGVLYAAGRRNDRPAVFRSRDDGASWIPLAGPFTREGTGFFNSVEIHPARPDTVFAAGSTGLFRSRNGGDRWLAFGEGLPAEVLLLRIPPAGGNTMFALSPENGRDWIYRSTDLGAHWVRLAGPQVNTSLLQLHDLVIDPQRARTLYAATSHGAFASDDGGDTWKLLNEGTLPLPVLALAVDPRNPRRLYAGSSEGGLYSLTRSP